jgi:hemoglobin
MDLNILELPFGSRPVVEKPNPEFLEQLGEERLRKLVSDHYDLLRKSDIAHLFPKEDSLFEQAKKKSADFFVQICGGHPYYTESRGKPKMMDKHKPFRISQQARHSWLSCYQKLLPELEIEKHLIEDFWRYLNVFSIWMINVYY